MEVYKLLYVIWEGGIHVVYARPSDRPFITKERIMMRRVVTDEAKSIRQFYEDHRIEIHIDSDTHKPMIKVYEMHEQ